MPSSHRAPRSWPIALLLLLAVACRSGHQSGGQLHVPSPAWEDQVIYFVMTDRFANGDPSNDDQGRGEYDPADGRKYSGGDLQGLIDRLDYIQGLGATAVWITPPVANMWWDPLQQSGGYHGYWARDLGKVDEHLGTLDTYKALSRELHRRGMYLIQDVVPNHMGNFFTYSSYDPNDVGAGVIMNDGAVPTSRPTQSPFDQDDPADPTQRAAAIYHWTPTIVDYNDPVQETDWQVSDLDDLNTENPVVRKALRQAYGRWITEVGVDAFRVDTVKYAPHAFWNDFFHAQDPDAPGILAVAKATGRSSFLAFGEVYETPLELEDAADRKVASYLGTPDAPELPAVIEYPLYSEIGRVFAEGRPTSDMTYRLARFMDPSLFPNPNTTPTFVDNHDVQRFLATGTRDALAQALDFLFTVPGIPVVYYGTEQLFTDTRAAMFKGGYLAAADRYDATTPTYQHLKALTALRRGRKVFTRGDLHVVYDNPAGPGPLAYTRTLADETALVVMNTADQRVVVSGLETGLPEGAVLERLFAEKSVAAPEVGAAGKVTMVLPARGVLVARATGAMKPPTPPGATITVTTPIAGQTFSQDVTIAGTVSPATARLRMVLDSYLDVATDVHVQPDGSWSVVLPVSGFPTGRQEHNLLFYAPDQGVATAPAQFTSDVVFVGQTYVFGDPAGDDAGPSGAYTYPQDPTFGHQMDVTGVTLEVGATTLNVRITMADWSSVWAPKLGFDHVAFNLFFALPGQAASGATVLPRLSATTPAGFAWNLDQFTYGWGNVMYLPDPTTPTEYGPTTAAPVVRADVASKTVTFTYDRTRYGIASWSGTQIWITTWDFDGIGGAFRRLTATGGQWDFGGGTTGCDSPDGCSDPKLMDTVGPLAIP